MSELIEVQRLKPNAVGLPGVLFMAVATAAPITAMVGNVPISVGFGNGVYAPAGYLVATVVLTLFAIGYAAMSRHITTTGAFYGYISHGLGRIVGLGAGVLTALAYMVFEAALIGIFSFFGADLFSSLFGVTVPWLVFAAGMLTVNAVLTYFDITLAAKVLGVFLVTEILMLALMAFSVLFTGGGPQGWSWGSLNPLNGFHSLGGVIAGPDGSMMAVAGSAGVAEGSGLSASSPGWRSSAPDLRMPLRWRRIRLPPATSSSTRCTSISGRGPSTCSKCCC